MSKLSEITLGELADLIAARVVAAMRDDAGFAAEDKAAAKSVVDRLIVDGTDGGSYTLAELEAIDRDELVTIAAELGVAHTPKARKPTIIDGILSAIQPDASIPLTDEQEPEDEDDEEEFDDELDDEPESDDDDEEDEEDEEEPDDDEPDEPDDDEPDDDESDEEEDEEDEEEDDDEPEDDDDDFWTEDELSDKSLGELRAIAKDYDIDTKGMSKDAVIQAILTD